jgi:hypothetical protein
MNTMPFAGPETTGTSGRAYDVSPDGQRFLMIKAPAIDASITVTGLIVVQHLGRRTQAARTDEITVAKAVLFANGVE